MEKKNSRENAAENKENQSAGAELAAFLKSHKKERHVIVLQEFPDPDAIAAGFAHQCISSHFGIETDMLYSGRISHQQNLALVRLLGIEMTRFDSSIDLSGYDGAVFVDNQGTSAGAIADALDEKSVPPLVIVDHHEPQNRLSPQFKDVRRDIGATATIYTQYLQDGIIDIDKTNKIHTMMATALTHGIMTDTRGFIRAQPDDFDAAAYLSAYRDSDLLDQIMNQDRSKQTMKVIYKALGTRETVESFSVAGIGYLRAEDRDAIPQAADFLITEENVHTAIVYGIVTGENWEESVIGSLRTNRITIDPDHFIKEVFGKDAKGQYFGGGKVSAGGFHIPIGFLSGGSDEEFREQKWEVFDDQIKQKIFAKIGAQPNSAKEEGKQ
ncbi:MAG TPA: bifunctional oligoribonuclease/PAP phosphatase NrnA [Desulfosalsimonadaceae bacterium]|nr:bifunctional oligoribonuclease/PAP phosphatase NrnA [Desulfosalsimonadaceae bacterium]